ncbi:hypothetical protein [Moraxella caviae]|uniref:hypothetical protein n=1 Tax=Moraxella caviae TaxID=34060 RepID=UPI001558BDA9|nr:hypothetical protein [Moraxella caviae]
MDEVPFGSDAHRHWIGRFYELPLFIELLKPFLFTLAMIRQVSLALCHCLTMAIA